MKFSTELIQNSKIVTDYTVITSFSVILGWMGRDWGGGGGGRARDFPVASRCEAKSHERQVTRGHFL